MNINKADAGFTVSSILVLALAMACERAPTTPTPSEPVVTRVEVIAPRSLAPGANVQLQLIGHRTNGSTLDLTSTARFYTNASETLQTSSTGMTTALRLGEGVVVGQTDTLSSSREIVVVPDGTYRVVGRVFEESAPSLPVAGARVESAGALPMDTDFSGQYRLYGVAGAGRLRISKTGYLTRDVALSIADHHIEDVSLPVAGPRVDVAGVYQMTIDVGVECREKIPEALQARRYTAAITQLGSEIRVVLTGARFFPQFSSPSSSTVIPGRVEHGQIALDLAWPTHCEGTEPDSRVVEIIDGTTYLEISGSGTLAPAGEGFAGTLRGLIAIRSDPRCGSPATAACEWSQPYRVMLTR
jgi:hypothetical protein